MLKRSKIRKASTSRSPQATHDSLRSLTIPTDQASVHNLNNMAILPQQRSAEPFSPTYAYPGHDGQMQHVPTSGQMQANQVVAQTHHPRPQLTDAEQIWRGFEMTSNEQLPVWISDQSLGGQSFPQHGYDAFLLPADYLPPAPQIW